MVPPETYVGLSDIKKNMVTMMIYQFKHNIPRADLEIV